MVIAMDGDLSFRDRLDPSLDLIFPAFDARRNDTIAMVRRCRSVLRRVAPDLLVTTNWGAIEWAIARIGLNLPHVHIEDGLGPDELDGQFSRRVWTRRLVLRRSTVVVPSHGLARMAREDWHVSSSRLRLIPNGVDTIKFSPSGRRPGGVLVIGTVAALRPEKNIGRLLHAFQIVRAQIDARLIIAGDGPERPVLEALAATLGISADVRFTGHLTRPETVFAGFDIFAISSDTEQLPLSVL